MTNVNNPIDLAIVDTHISRRGMLRAGGITIGMAALVAACTEPGKDVKPARVGDSPAPPKLVDAVITDGVLFRTATSLHFSAIDSHNISKKIGGLSDGQTALVDAYIAANNDAIATLQKLSEAAGSTAWTCANPRFDRVVLIPIEGRIDGRPKEGNEEADVAPSPDKNRDALGLAQCMEALIAAMHQSLVPHMSLPEYRGALMTQGHAAARRASALALAIEPLNVVSPATLTSASIAVPANVAETTTTVQDIATPGTDSVVTTTTVATFVDLQQFYAIPSQFGTLSAVQLTVGAPIAGVQITFNIETPSLNSFVYDYQVEC